MNRVGILSQQIAPNYCSSGKIINEVRSKDKTQWFKEQGWGYKDTEFAMNKQGQAMLTGTRYLYSGHVLPSFRAFAEKNMGLDMNLTSPAQAEMPVDAPILNKAFLDSLKSQVDEVSTDRKQRVMHSHGHALEEIFLLRHGKFARTVDAVVWINSHEQAEKVVASAVEHDVCLIPYGGGTNVTLALLPPKEETRMIVSVDTTRMNKIKWVDRKNLKACIETGILGQDLERELTRYGVVFGHEPDSVEFSSLGGWISTRASGMKKNAYGNIEDIVLQIKIVTPTGTIVKNTDSPRVSSGPDIDEIIMGSEGNYGIITEVVVKIREQPQVKEYNSIVFPNFDNGVKFMHDVAKSRIWPASLRLVDNTQFQFAMSIKPAENSAIHQIMTAAKKVFLEKIKNFDLTQIAVATIVYEGTIEQTNAQKRVISQLAGKHGGMMAGRENGERGYFLTFMIAYLRDYGFNFSYIGESFETSVAWSQITPMCQKTQQRIVEECKKRGVKKAPWISFRVTQVYDTGAAVYVYLGFPYAGLKDPVGVYTEIEDAARDEIMKNGGSISHHHGVGKLRKQFLPRSIGEGGVKLLKGVKATIDPKNIFGARNLI